MKLVCKKCAYRWEYTGNKHRTSCSRCKTSVTLQQQHWQQPQPQQPLSGDEQVRQHTERALNHKQVYMPVGMAKQLNKFLLARLIGIAAANGDDWIKFNVNNDGVLSLA